MPELPEVETVRTGLSRSWIGKRIDGVELRRESLRFPFPDNLDKRLTGRTITNIRRRAKYLLIDLDNDEILLSHLGMSGKWILDASSSEGKHDHVVLYLDDGTMSIYNDPRRFGVLDLMVGTSHKLLDHLGPRWWVSTRCSSPRTIMLLPSSFSKKKSSCAPAGPRT